MYRFIVFKYSAFKRWPGVTLKSLLNTDEGSEQEKKSRYVQFCCFQITTTVGLRTSPGDKFKTLSATYRHLIEKIQYMYHFILFSNINNSRPLSTAHE